MTRIRIMPRLIRTVPEILKERRQDTYFLMFTDYVLAVDPAAVQRAREVQLAWLDVRGIEHEVAAPEGLMEGDPWLHAVFFTSADDPHLHEYIREFEDTNGNSMEPELYQMFLVPYKAR